MTPLAYSPVQSHPESPSLARMYRVPNRLKYTIKISKCNHVDFLASRKNASGFA